MIMSQTSRYAIKAVFFLSQNGKGRPLKVREVSEHLNIPQNYLSKIFHVLTRNGVLKSSTGKSGGFSLATPAEELPLSKIIEPFESSDLKITCILGQQVCSDENPCSAHSRWKSISEIVSSFFNMTTLRDLTEREKQIDILSVASSLHEKT